MSTITRTHPGLPAHLAQPADPALLPTPATRRYPRASSMFCRYARSTGWSSTRRIRREAPASDLGIGHVLGRIGMR